jgi:hypothetical protein
MAISPSNFNYLQLSPSTPDHKKNQKLNQEFQSLKKEKNVQLEKINEVTLWMKKDGEGRILGDEELEENITQRIKGIYSSVKVRIIKKEIKIEIKRSWCLYDLIPLGVFLPTLLNANSVFRKETQKSIIRDFLLNAKPTEGQLRELLRDIKPDAVIKAHLIEDFHAVAREKHRQDLPFEITEQDTIDKTRDYIDGLTEFLNQLNHLSLKDGEEQLNIAYWKSKSFTITLPEQRQNARIEENAGCATSFAISFAKCLRRTG